MPTFKQKNVIKSFKLRLQEKLKAVTEETENATSYLNNCVAEFSKRVKHILEIKDEKFLSLYRELIQDLEDYSESLFIWQAEIKGSENKSDDSSEDESSANTSKDCSEQQSSASLQNENFLETPSYLEQGTDVLELSEQNAIQPKFAKDYPSQQNLPENLNLNRQNAPLSKSLEKNVNARCRYPGKSLDLQRQNKTVSESFENSINVQRELGGNFNPSVSPLDKDVECLEQNTHSSLGDVHNDGGSITEDDFYSLHSDNNAQSTNSALFSPPLHDKEALSTTDYLSNVSASQSSCYQSISSSINEPLVLQKGTKKAESANSYSVETKVKTLNSSELILSVIHPVEFEISSSFSATLSDITDPSDFWIYTENLESFLRFPRSEYVDLKGLSSIKEGQYCLGPFDSQVYYRAKSLSNAKSEAEMVRVLFIDRGTTGNFPLHDLRLLPAFAYEIPAQAINCFLHGIAPVEDTWSNEAIEKFKEFQNYSIEAVVKSKENTYGVHLTSEPETTCDFLDGVTLSTDIAESLCLAGLAISLSESSHDIGEQQKCESQRSKSLSAKTDSSLEVSGFYDINAISSDSGVSVTSTYKSSQIYNKRQEIFNRVSEDCSSVAVKSTLPHDNSLIGLNHDSQMKDLISFESSDGLDSIKISNEEIKASNSLPPLCLLCKYKDFCLHLKISSPSLLFVEKDMAIVMLSHIVNPHEFYVNMAMENIVTLDDLREQMTSTYESEKNLPSIEVNDLYEKMFCAGRFDDGYWYRVKIVRVSMKDKQNNEVLAQYVDYGNTSLIKCHFLKPLTPEFSIHPSFAIRCSLAGITPIESAMSNGELCWPDSATEVFKKLTSYDRCLTAQICNEFSSSQKDTYSVLLWDTDDSDDLLINLSLVENKVAAFDESVMQSLSSSGEKNLNPNIDAWNPMLEEYIDSHNSYAVDDEDIEVATTGYRARDEEYTCKYFALRGHCPRGVNCQYEHLPLLESGVTRDQEEVYCVDTTPIISETVNNTLVQISAIVTPAHFYVVLPFGCQTVDDIDDKVYKGAAYNDIINSEAKALFYGLQKHYSNQPFQEKTTIALSIGTIVVAKRKWDEKWHRGRIIDVIGINKPTKVFFVDSGDQEWVPRKFIRTILPEYLYTPFQAIQCSLHGIVPAGAENGSSWSPEALSYFKDLVAGEILLAEIIHRFGRSFEVSLRKTSRQDHGSVAEHMVSAGYAQYQKVSKSASYKKEVLYVPG